MECWPSEALGIGLDQMAIGWEKIWYSEKTQCFLLVGEAAFRHIHLIDLLWISQPCDRIIRTVDKDIQYCTHGSLLKITFLRDLLPAWQSKTLWSLPLRHMVLSNCLLRRMIAQAPWKLPQSISTVFVCLLNPTEKTIMWRADQTTRPLTWCETPVLAVYWGVL